MKYDIKKGKSGIHIKPENKGKFTATKKKTGKTTEELTHSKNPVTRKRAIFAQNAKRWHHKKGGNLQKFQSGKTFPSVYGTHNPDPTNQLDTYGARFIPQNEMAMAMQNWVKNRGNIKTTYNTMATVDTNAVAKLPVEDIWKLRQQTRDNYMNVYSQVNNESESAKMSIMTDQIRGPRSNYIPEEVKMNNYYQAQKDSLRNAFKRFDSYTKPIMLRKEKETGLTDDQIKQKWNTLFSKKRGGTIDVLQPSVDKFKSGGEVQFKYALENNFYRKPNYAKAKCGKKLTKKVEKKQLGGVQLASNTKETPGQRTERLNRLKQINKRDAQAGTTSSVYNLGEPTPKVEKYFNPSMLHQMGVMAQNNGTMPVYKMPKGSPEPGLGSLPGNITPAVGTCAGNASRGGAVDNWGTGGTKLIKRSKGGKLLENFDIKNILSTWKK